MQKHAYDPATGELVGTCMASSAAQLADWVAKGFTVTSGPAVKREDYNYLGGILTPKRAVQFSADKTTITADGVDQALVTVQVAGDSPPESIEIWAQDPDGKAGETVSLTAGQGALSPITADQACEITLGVVDTIKYKTSGAVITATAV